MPSSDGAGAGAGAAGAGRALSADDARILALQSGTVMGHTLKLLIVEAGTPIDIEDLCRTVRARIDRYPRALDRVEHRPSGPVWIREDGIDIDRHVRRTPDVTTREEMRRRIGELMSTPLDPARPLWSIDLIGPLEDGSQAIAVRIHHAVADGIGALAFLHAVLFEDAEARPRPAGAPAAPVAPVATVAQPPWAVWEHLPASLLHEYGVLGSRSPFDRRLSSHRELAFVAMPITTLHEIGRARPVPATVNDVLLAVVAGAIRRWLGASHALPRVRAQIPVSLHTAGEDAATAGNRDSFLNVDLLLSEADDARRLDGIRAQTAVRKRNHDALMMDDVFRALARAGGVGALLRGLAESPRVFGVAVSNVPGPRQPVTVAGRAVAHLYSSSEPAEHHALRITAISNDRWMGVGLCVDPTAIDDVTRLGDALLDAYTALHRSVMPAEPDGV